MRTPPLTTRICLPPGLLPRSQVEAFLRLALEEFRWFEPRRYGFASLDEQVNPERIDYQALLSYYEENRTLFVAARTDRDFLMLFTTKPEAPLHEPPYAGGLTWVTSAKSASKASWRTAHIEQVVRVMRLVGSPLAWAGMDDDIERKTRRLVDRGTHSDRIVTVRAYDEGLAGLFWRNFYGLPFVRLFGERFATLPPECRQSLGEDVFLVQPYALPTEAGSEAGIARERDLISRLGPECFYDHERHTLPTRRPVLDHLAQPLH